MRSHNATREGRNRGDEDDAAPVAFSHPGCDPLRQHKSSTQIDLHGLIPLFQRQLFQPLAIPHASIADQYIDGAELRLRHIDQRLHLGWLVQVSTLGKCAPSHLADVIGKHMSRLFLVCIAKRDIGSNLCHTQRGRIANAAASPRDQRNTSA